MKNLYTCQDSEVNVDAFLTCRRHKVNLRVLEQRLNKIQEESTTTNNKSDDNKEDEEEEEEEEGEVNVSQSGGGPSRDSFNVYV